MKSTSRDPEPQPPKVVSISAMSPQPEMEILARQFAFGDSFLKVIVEDFSLPHWDKSAGGGTNSAHWILGHLAVSRRFLARLVGAELEKEDWEATFDMGADFGVTEDSPSPPELFTRFISAGKVLRATLEGLDEEGCERELKRPFPDGSKTAAGAARFLQNHELYHFGQIGLIRSLCGLPPFA